MPGHVGEIRFNVGDPLFDLSGIEIFDQALLFQYSHIFLSLIFRK
jgi:hypothetical protein